MLWGDPVRKSDGGGRAVGWCVRLRCLEASFTANTCLPASVITYRWTPIDITSGVWVLGSVAPRIDDAKKMPASTATLMLFTITYLIESVSDRNPVRVDCGPSVEAV